MIKTFLSTAALLLASVCHPAMGQSGPQEFGKAGYYANYLHGQKTASGRLYNKNEYSAAHKTLDFGTRVKITRLDNNKSVVAEITDRGPFKDGFVTDVSYATATALGMIQEGVIRVSLEIVPANTPLGPFAVTPAAARETPAATGAITIISPHTGGNAPAQTTELPGIQPVSHNLAPKGATEVIAVTTGASPAQPLARAELFQAAVSRPARTGLGVQLEALTNLQSCMSEAARLNASWPGKILIAVEYDDANAGSGLFKILIGPFANRQDAEKYRADAARKGFPKAYLVDLSTL